MKKINKVISNPIKRTKKRAILVMVICTLLTTAAQFLWKIGVLEVNPESVLSFLNPSLVGGFVLYGLGSILVIYAFKNGELSVLYPILATSYVWVSLFSPIFFSETVNIWKWVGVGVIVLGVAFLGIGAIANNNHNNNNNDNNWLSETKSIPEVKENA